MQARVEIEAGIANSGARISQLFTVNTLSLRKVIGLPLVKVSGDGHGLAIIARFQPGMKRNLRIIALAPSPAVTETR